MTSLIWLVCFTQITPWKLLNDLQSSTAQKAAQALQSMYGTKYTVGTGADTLCKSTT